MVNLKAAHQELFRRQDDECFETLDELIQHCRTEREAGSELWHPPDILSPQIDGDRLRLHIGAEGKPFTLWTLVDTLTRLTQEIRYAGDRTQADIKIAQILALAT